MPHNPHAQFDQTVLDMIEHSPVGAVPHTPSYQDGLKRLLLAHQVYVSADYKNGHVTVRSLASLPSFYASNLEKFMAGAVDTAELESDASIFDRYVQSLPEALRVNAEARREQVVGRRQHHRAKHGAEIVNEPLHTLFLVPGAGPHPGLPGNYLFGSVFETPTGGWAVHVHDADDGASMCDTSTQSEALEKLQELLASSPFQLSELETLGFRSN
ncbi:MAG: hypothetical protein WC205_14380 [Opitutaceae bacterium]|jgi:hypothetical protein